jgi:hypothetical protein
MDPGTTWINDSQPNNLNPPAREHPPGADPSRQPTASAEGCNDDDDDDNDDNDDNDDAQVRA